MSMLMMLCVYTDSMIFWLDSAAELGLRIIASPVQQHTGSNSGSRRFFRGPLLSARGAPPRSSFFAHQPGCRRTPQIQAFQWFVHSCDDNSVTPLRTGAQQTGRGTTAMGSDKNRADDYTRESTLVRHVPLFEDVPIDIWYHAIDMIDGSDTLKACAVTCRAFLRRCRYRLFRCCVLRTFHDAKLLVRALRKDVDSRSFVRELHLSFNAATKPTGPVAKFLLPMLSDLQALWITGGRGSGIHPSFCASLFPVSTLR